MNKLLEIDSSANFFNEWGKENKIEPSDENKWKAIGEVFFNASRWKKKSRNKWHNEIRERALLNFYEYTEDHIAMCCRYSSEYGDKLNALNISWRKLLVNCTKDYCEKEDDLTEYNVSEFKYLTQKGGNNFNWDFELSDTNNSTGHNIKVEFKYIDKNGSGINQLSQFKGQVTESVIGKKIFNSTSYCEFFWDDGYFDRMWTVIEPTLGSTDDFKDLDKPTNRTEWIKSAKCTNEPTTNYKYYDFHKFMRVLNAGKKTTYKAQSDAKKEIINESFRTFITNQYNAKKINIGEFDKMFKTQNGKCFCILNKTGAFAYHYLPIFTIQGIHTNNTHAFFIRTDMTDYDIKVDMSWGNGGAGNNNPRMLISLCNKVASAGGDRKKKYRGGDGDDEIDEDDEDETDMAYDEADPIMNEINALDEARVFNNNRYVTRSGRESRPVQPYIPGTSGMEHRIGTGGKRKTKRKYKKSKKTKRKTRSKRGGDNSKRELNGNDEEFLKKKKEKLEKSINMARLFGYRNSPEKDRRNMIQSHLYTEAPDPDGVKKLQARFSGIMDKEGEYHEMDKGGLTFGGKKPKKSRKIKKTKKTKRKTKKGRKSRK
jgi:hypothetical protein